jgi:diguanylate cyclase (GGDEF)-like protein/PAS domain S-box-containing protein
MPVSRANLVSSLDAEAQRQKTDLVYRNAGIALSVTLVNGGLLSYVNTTLHAAAGAAFAWWCLLSFVAGGRYLLARRFMAAQPLAAAATIWRRRYVGATALTAAAWAAGTVLFMWQAPDGAQLFTGLVLSGMVAGAVPILAPVPAAFRVFAVLLSVPLAAVILLQANSALHWAFGSMALVFLAAVLASARYLHQTLDVAIRLGLEKGRLLENLERAGRAAETALEASNLSLWDFDIGTGRICLDENWVKIVGGEAGERTSSALELAQSIHPDDRQRAVRSVGDALTGRTPSYGEELRMRTASGDWKWIRCRGKVVERNAAGWAVRAVGTNVDISERKAAEQQLRIAAAAFESREATIITDADTVILRVNQAFTEITGYSVAEAVGQTPKLLQSGRHDADFYRLMWESIHRDGGWQGEIWDRRKNGEEYPKWLTISAVKDDEGTVTHYIGSHYDITERKRSEEKIQALAFYDQLTGLPNRTLLLDRLKQAMSVSARDDSFGALLFIDLDNFKTLNDTHGHEKGDLLLKQVAQRLCSCVRAGDTVARLGGDEFVVMLGSLSISERSAATQSEAVGEKILAALNQTYQLDDVAYHSTPSIGATLFKGHETALEDLVKQADLAMYKAKEAGRNTLRFFDPAMEIAVMARAGLEKDLREAIQQRQFVLYYQAQAAGSQLTGVEALVRWQHPQRGMVSPADFIPLAEEVGLILPLGHWVLETACGQLARWATRPEMAQLTIAVNVSARQFRQADFVAQVLGVLKRSGANPRRLKLELTESLLVSNVDDVIEKMFALKGKGVGFSLDDFGTGYSSLAYLKRLPLDQLKIDQSFVRDVLSDPNDAAIARTIIALAQSLGLGVIAEGVETEAQRDFLASSGCPAYQGYFFSRPLPLVDFEEFARRH